MLPDQSHHSDTFRKMPIKHLRCGLFVTPTKNKICYSFMIIEIRRYMENFHQYLHTIAVKCIMMGARLFGDGEGDVVGVFADEYAGIVGGLVPFRLAGHFIPYSFAVDGQVIEPDPLYLPTFIISDYQ